MLVHLGRRDGAFADRGGDAFDRAVADVADGEYAGHAGFQRERGRGVAEAIDLYTRQSCLMVTAADLAVMGATLADGGVNPLTGARVAQQAVCHYALAVMATAGMYETSGDWLYDVGVPGNSGIGGGIVAVAPGKGGLGTFAPLLDDAGNSIKGQRVAKFLSQRLGLSLFTSNTDG